MANPSEPHTLQQAILFFKRLRQLPPAVVAIRWPDGVVNAQPAVGARHLSGERPRMEVLRKAPQRQVLAEGRNHL